VQSGRDAGWRRDPLDFEVLSCRVVALTLDIGFPGIGSSQDGAVWPFELGQVPTEPLAAADDASSPWSDYDKSFML
jgi:hypothetical protein